METPRPKRNSVIYEFLVGAFICSLLAVLSALAGWIYGVSVTRSEFRKAETACENGYLSDRRDGRPSQD
jgi:hypothetical protein